MKKYSFYFTFVLFVFGCKQNESETSSTKYPACDSSAVDLRCMQKTRGDKNAVEQSVCSSSYRGTVRNECPRENVIATCVNKKGSSDETTIFYYEGHDSKGKEHCDTQKIHDGVYSEK